MSSKSSRIGYNGYITLIIKGDEIMHKKLTIDKKHLVNVLVKRAHASTCDGLYPYRVAVAHGDNESKGRIIFADTPSTIGGYFENMEGEVNYIPEDFLDQSSSYIWGEGEENSEDYISKEVAKDWIAENLIDEVELDGEVYAVEYIN
jgi:hypothetical protein